MSERGAMSEMPDSTTPFCLSCGEWVLEVDEMLVSPFTYCTYCDPKKKVRRNRRMKDIS